MDFPPDTISSPVEEVFDNARKNHYTRHRNVYLATFAAQLYIVGMGLVSSYTSPAGEDILKSGSRFKHITSNENTWIASLPNLSGVLGNAISGYFSHKYGRKCVLIYISTTFTLSWLLIAYAPTVHFIYAGRILSGFSAGICTVAVPAYVVEISTVEIRGFLTAGFQVAFAVGVVIMSSFGIILRWSWLAIVGAIVAVVGACLLYFMPESPPWLVRNGKYGEAMRGIRFLRGKKHDAAREFKEITENIAQEPRDGLTLREFLNPSLYKPLLIAFGLMFNMSFCGFPAVMSYTVKVFKEEGNSFNPNVAATIVVVIQMIATMLSSLLMDRAGRKSLYVTSGSLMTLTLIALGAYTYCSQKYDASTLSHWSWVPLVSFMIYIAAFSIGFGPMPFVVIPELVPTHSRSFVMAVGCASGSLLGFIVIKTFDILRITIGLYGLYWLYGALTFSGFLAYFFFVPETKGRSIHEINKTFSKSALI